MRFKNILTISAVLLSSFFYVRISYQNVLIGALVGHSASVKSLDFHPNDKIWDAYTGQKLFDYNSGVYGHLDQKVSLAFKPGEEDILAFGGGDYIKIFEISPERELIQRDFFEH